MPARYPERIVVLDGALPEAELAELIAFALPPA